MVWTGCEQTSELVVEVLQVGIVLDPHSVVPARQTLEFTVAIQSAVTALTHVDAISVQTSGVRDAMVEFTTLHTSSQKKQRN